LPLAATPIGVEYSIAVPGAALPWRFPGQEHIFGAFGAYPILRRRELGPVAGPLQRDFRMAIQCTSSPAQL